METSGTPSAEFSNSPWQNIYLFELMTTKHPPAAPLLREWKALLSLPVAELIEIMTDIRHHARELRHVTPFAGILSGSERASVYRSFEAELSVGAVKSK